MNVLILVSFNINPAYAPVPVIWIIRLTLPAVVTHFRSCKLGLDEMEESVALLGMYRPDAGQP